MALCTIKYLLCVSLWLSSTSHAFVVHSLARHSTLMIQKSAVTSTSEDVFEKLGIEQEQLAVGIDPREVLNYIGT